MGKGNDPMGLKKLANRAKAKGLQRLRWYCQICEKQCRDENGFKCHLTSESHQRNMAIFGENPHKVIEDYSREFESAFMEHLRMAHRTTTIRANRFYNEYIADKEHVHMNATKWQTLTEFVKYLGRTGKCVVEDHPTEGWLITYIERDDSMIKREDQRAKRKKAEEDASQREAKRVMLQAVAAAATAPGGAQQREVRAAVDLEGAARAKVGLAFRGGGGSGGGRRSVAVPFGDNVFAAAAAPGGGKVAQQGGGAGGGSGGGSGGGLSAMEQIMRDNEDTKRRQQARAAQQAAAAQQRQQQRDPKAWLREGIVVKCVAKSLGDDYYKRKGDTLSVESRGRAARVRMHGSGDELLLDASYCQTVLPKPGGAVVVLRGAYAGERATLLAVDMDKYVASVQLERGGVTLEGLEYEDISKAAG